MTLELKQSSLYDGFKLSQKACSLLSSNGCRKEAKELSKKSKDYGYDFYFVLKLLKEYVEI